MRAVLGGGEGGGGEEGCGEGGGRRRPHERVRQVQQVRPGLSGAVPGGGDEGDAEEVQQKVQIHQPQGQGPPQDDPQLQLHPRHSQGDERRRHHQLSPRRRRFSAMTLFLLFPRDPLGFCRVERGSPFPPRGHDASLPLYFPGF